jgi:hypothetical protein
LYILLLKLHNFALRIIVSESNSGVKVKKIVPEIAKFAMPRQERKKINPLWRAAYTPG